MTTRKKIALVGPSFFSYIEAIRGKLAQRGFESRFFDERHSNGILVKILYRIGFYSKFTARKDRHLDEVCAQIFAAGFEAVVLIDVEVCDRRFVQQLLDAGVRVYLYMWDSARNKPRYLDYLPLLAGSASFDPEDCEAHGMTYIPLFAEDVFSARHNPAAPPADGQVDIAFCGTLHSNRARRLGELLRVAHRDGLKVSLLLYFYSRWLLLIKSLVRYSHARFLGCVSTVGFSKQQIFELFTRSKFVFDLPHPDQVGLTARTFEALRAGRRLITFNRAAQSLLPAAFADRVFVIESAQDVHHLDFTSPAPNPILSEADDYYLSLDRFVDQILALMQTPGLARQPAVRAAVSS
jgi:hypothetical protein